MNQKSLEIVSAQKKQGKGIIGCFPLYPPVELFASMNLHPIVLWHLRASIHSLIESDQHIQDYACSIARELVQFVLSGPEDLLDAIYSYNACDTLRNIPEILHILNIPMLRMHVPQINQTQCQSNQYLAREVANLIKATEDAFSVQFSPEKFIQSIDDYTKMRDLCQLAEKRVAQGLLSFDSFCRVVLSGYFFPIKEQITNLQALTGQSDNNISTNKKVFLSGIMPPPSPIIRAIEKAGMCVVGNDIASLHRNYAYSPKPTENPGEYYTDLFQNRFPCTTLLYKSDERVNTFCHIVAQSEAKGVIFVGEKFCEYEYFEFPYMEKRLKDMDVRTLLLEFAVNDAHHLDAYITRIQAFSEMLNNK